MPRAQRYACPFCAFSWPFSSSRLSSRSSSSTLKLRLRRVAFAVKGVSVRQPAAYAAANSEPRVGYLLLSWSDVPEEESTCCSEVMGVPWRRTQLSFCSLLPLLTPVENGLLDLSVSKQREQRVAEADDPTLTFLLWWPWRLKVFRRLRFRLVGWLGKQAMGGPSRGRGGLVQYVFARRLLGRRTRPG